MTGIRTALLREVCFLIIVSFVISGAFLYIIGRKYILQKHIFAVQQLASSQTFTAQNSFLNHKPEEVSSAFKELSRNPAFLWASLQDENGSVLYHTSGLMVGASLRDDAFLKALSLAEFSSHEYSSSGKKNIEFVRPVYNGSQKIGVIRAVFSYQEILKTSRKDIWELLSMYLVACALIFTAGIVIVNMRGFSIVRRIQRVEKGAEEITQGKLGSIVEEEGHDEITLLTRTVNEMSVKLKEIDRLKNEFIARVSHELKSPVSVIKGFVEKLQEEKTLPRKAQEYVSQLSYGSDRLERLVHQTLNISRIQAGKMDYHFEKISLGEIFPEVAGFFREKITDKNIKLLCEIEDDLPPVRADSEAVCEIMANLLSNAVKCTRAGSIRIWAKSNSGDVLAGVEDTGIGIPQEHVKHLFDSFVQVPENRRKMPESKGAGLGLSIVKSIVESHGGAIRIESIVDKGTNVTFTLPFWTTPIAKSTFQ